VVWAERVETEREREKLEGEDRQEDDRGENQFARRKMGLSTITVA